MLVKRTARNQITLPRKIADRFRDANYFRVSLDGDRIVLEPVRSDRAFEMRKRLEQLGITEQDITDAVAWARRLDRPS